MALNYPIDYSPLIWISRQQFVQNILMSRRQLSAHSIAKLHDKMKLRGFFFANKFQTSSHLIPPKIIQSSWFVLFAYSLLTSTLTVKSPTADVSSRAAGEEEEVVGVDGGVSPSGPPPWEEEVVPPEDEVVEESLDERRRLLQEF